MTAMRPQPVIRRGS